VTLQNMTTTEIKIAASAAAAALKEAMVGATEQVNATTVYGALFVPLSLSLPLYRSLSHTKQPTVGTACL
jgi:hypothetical protein